MKVLEIASDGKLTITPEALMIKELRAVWERDKTPSKKRAREELAFIFWKGYYDSVYDIYATEAEKDEAITTDVITMPKWKPDDKIKAAVDKFVELQRTFAMAFLDSVMVSARQMKGYFEKIDLNERDKSGKPVWKATDLVNTVSKSIEIIEAIDKWKERARKELELKESKIRGGGQAGVFEDPERATWIKSSEKGIG